jgi:hypothetical protein
LEQAVTVNTAAAGGNVSLLTGDAEADDGDQVS